MKPNKIKNLSKIAIFCAFAALMLSTSAAFAQFGMRPALTAGMSKSQVQAKWGQPKIVVDKGLIGESTWIFAATEKLPEQTLLFRSSRLVSIIGGEPMTEEPAEVAKPRKKIVAEAFMPIVSEKDLNEVLNQVPSDEDGSKEVKSSPAKFN